MPTNAFIPDTAEYREAIIPLAEASHFTGFILVGDYLFGCSETGIGKLLKVKKDDFSVRFSVTFPNDGEHIGPVDLCYASSQDKIYVLFRNLDTGQLTIGKVAPGSGAVAPTIEADFVNVDLTGDFTVGPGSLTTDNTNLYVVSFHDTPSQINKYLLSSGAFVLNGQVTGFTQAHCMRFSAGKLYASGLQTPATAWVARLDATTLALEQSATFAAPEGEFAVDEIGISSDSVWVGNRDELGVVRKYSKSNLNTVTQLSTGQLSKCTCVESDGQSIWALYENGHAVRFNPATNEQNIYTLNPGEGYQLELTGDATYLYTVFATALTTKITRYRIPSDVVHGQLYYVTFTDGELNGQTVGQSRPAAIAIDSEGSSLVAGQIQGRVNFGNGIISDTGQTLNIDGFFGKYSSAGVIQWVKRLGTTAGGDVVSNIIVDSQGFIITQGRFIGTVDFGGTSRTSTGYPNAVGPDMFVAKYSNANPPVLQWVTTFGGQSNDVGGPIAVDSSDNVILAGQFASSSIIIDGETFNTSGQEDFVLVKLNGSNGSVMWKTKYGGTDTDSPFSMAVNSSGDIFLVGSFRGTTNLGSGNISASPATSKIFLAKYSGTNGAAIVIPNQLPRAIGTSGVNSANGIAIDPRNGDVIITGGAVGAVNYGGGLIYNIESSVGNVVFLAAYSSDGVYRWAQQFGDGNTVGSIRGFDVVAGNSGNISIIGQTSNSLYMGNNVFLDAPVGAGYFIIHFISPSAGASAVYQWGRIAGRGISAGLRMAQDASGGLLSVGYVAGPVNFGPGPDGITDIVAPVPVASTQTFLARHQR